MKHVAFRWLCHQLFNLTLIWFPPLLTVSGDHHILPAFILLQTAPCELPHHYSAFGLFTGWVVPYSLIFRFSTQPHCSSTTVVKNIDIVINFIFVFVLRLCHRHRSESTVKHVGPHRQRHHAAQLSHIQRHVCVHGGLGGVPGSVSQNSRASPPYIWG